MVNVIFRPALTVALLLLLVPIATAAQGILDGTDDPKYVGGTAVLGLVVALGLVVLGTGPARPGLAMPVLGGAGVMALAVSWLFGTLATVLVVASALVLFALCLAAAVSTMNRTTDDVVTRF